MEQYIPKSVIENILRNLWKKDDGHNAEHRVFYNKILQEVQCEIDVLEIKEVDLDKEIDKWYNNEASKEFENVVYEDIEKCAKHFFELGLIKAWKGE